MLVDDAGRRALEHRRLDARHRDRRGRGHGHGGGGAGGGVGWGPPRPGLQGLRRLVRGDSASGADLGRLGLGTGGGPDGG